MKKLLLFASVMFAANLSRGQWEPEIRLTHDLFASYTNGANAKCIAVHGDTVHVTWQDNRDGNNEIYYKRSTDGGISWDSDTRLTNDPGDSQYPSVAVSGSFVQVVWQDNRDGNQEIYHKRSTDGGTTWDGDLRLTNATGNSLNPSISVFDAYVHVVWEEYRNGNSEVYYKRSTDRGINWEPDARLTNSPGNSEYPSIAVLDTIVQVVWQDYRDGNYEIYHKRSTDGGVSWGTDSRITMDNAYSFVASIALSDSVVYIAWYDNRDGNYEIYFNRSLDNGITWGSDQRLTLNMNYSYAPNISASGPIVHLVWEDGRNGGNNNGEIYYKRSMDWGTTWGSDTRLSNASGASEYPSVAMTDSAVHVVWSDIRDGNEEIYYKRDPTGNLLVGTNNDLTNKSCRQISIYPNPASNNVHITYINYSNMLTGQADEKTVLTIRNILGEELVSKLIQNGEGIIDVSRLQNGIYYVGIEAGIRQTVSTKLIILK